MVPSSSASASSPNPVRSSETGAPSSTAFRVVEKGRRVGASFTPAILTVTVEGVTKTRSVTCTPISTSRSSPSFSASIPTPFGSKDSSVPESDAPPTAGACVTEKNSGVPSGSSASTARSTETGAPFSVACKNAGARVGGRSPGGLSSSTSRTSISSRAVVSTRPSSAPSSTS